MASGEMSVTSTLCSSYSAVNTDSARIGEKTLEMNFTSFSLFLFISRHQINEISPTFFLSSLA